MIGQTNKEDGKWIQEKYEKEKKNEDNDSPLETKPMCVQESYGQITGCLEIPTRHVFLQCHLCVGVNLYVLL
jgi:hypothetical protein